MDPRIVITGMGTCSALGLGTRAAAARLAASEGGIREHHDLMPGGPVFAGLLPESLPPAVRRSAADQPLDRTAQLAAYAAEEALDDAGIGRTGLGRFAPERVAVVLGTSHGGRSRLDAFVLGGSDPSAAGADELVLVSAAHQEQAAAIAARLSIHGPVLTISTACSSGTAAIARAARLVVAGHVDVAIAGGADAFSRLTFAGFQALGAVADGPCAPFSERIGMTLGEGAAFVVLERLDDALTRGAPVAAELFGTGTSWDAWHMTEPDPTGAGLARAFSRALASSGLQPDAIDYVHAHGTGTRANDAAECLAMKRIFSRVPRLSSTKSFTGHALGASAAHGLVFTLLAAREGIVPATLGHVAPRRGCDLDFVPRTARRAKVSAFAVNACGFGGANVVVVAGVPRPIPACSSDEPVVITGIGSLCAAGAGAARLESALREARGSTSAIDRFDTSRCLSRRAVLVPGFDPRALARTVDVRRLDTVMQYAAVAAAEALADAGLSDRSRVDGTAIGLVAATARGAVGSLERYLESVRGGRWDHASPTHFPNLVMSALGGHLSRALLLKGLVSTAIGGSASTLAAVAGAADLLREDPSQQAVVVVAADYVSELLFRLHDRRGRLARAGDEERVQPYARDARGTVLGEGAAAIVVERAGNARRRGARAYAQLAGSGLTFDARPHGGLAPAGSWLERALAIALQKTGCGASQVDGAIGLGRGDPAYDGREAAAFSSALPDVPLVSAAGVTGHAEAASGLFAIVSAALALRRGELAPVAGSGPFLAGARIVAGAPLRRALRRIVVAGSSEEGGNAAVVLQRAEGD